MSDICVDTYWVIAIWSLHQNINMNIFNSIFVQCFSAVYCIPIQCCMTQNRFPSIYSDLWIIDSSATLNFLNKININQLMTLGCLSVTVSRKLVIHSYLICYLWASQSYIFIYIYFLHKCFLNKPIYRNVHIASQQLLIIW